MPRTHKIAAIPGDGIGREVVAAGIRGVGALAEREEIGFASTMSIGARIIAGVTAR